MAIKEHVKLVKRGAKAVKKWRKANTELLDLSAANLCDVDLSEVDLSFARLDRADLSDAKLRSANLHGADFSNADLNGADLSQANLVDTDFNHANLMDADFSDACLDMTKFDGAIFCSTMLHGINLSEAIGLDETTHFGESTIDLKTFTLSGGDLPHKFLRGCGMSEDQINRLPAMFGLKPPQYFSCFISYSHSDEEFCRQLHMRLRQEKLKVFYAPESMRGGKKLYEQISDAIHMHDKLLLVLSEASMASEWVATEIYKARQREVSERKQILFPIRLATIETIKRWEKFDADSGKDMAREIREFFIPDFSNWEDIDTFEDAFEGLFDALKAVSPTE